MYPVSEGFNGELEATTRKVYGKVQIDYTDPFIDQSITMSANENATISYPYQTANSINDSFAKIASLDGSWVLGQGYSLAPAAGQELNYEMGWWGSTLSDASGNFAVPYPTLTAEFASRPIRSLKVVGDSKREEYPVDFKINLYDSNDELSYVETITNNTNIVWLGTIPSIPGIVKMTLEVTKWSHSNRQVKILEFFTSIQETYEGDDVLEIRLTEEREISSGSLPVGNISANEIFVKLNNTSRYFDAGNNNSPIYQLVKANRKIRAWIGAMVNDSIEYVPLGEFWSGDWDVPENHVYATTRGLDKLELLRQTDYKTSQVKFNISLYQLAIDVLNDAGVPITEYWVDTALQSFVVPYGYFEIVSHREALRRIAEAALGQVYVSREGILRVEGPLFLESKTTADAYIDRNLYFAKNSPSSEIANYIEVEAQTLRTTSTQQLYEEQIAVPSGTHQYTVNFNKFPCVNASGTLTGGTNISLSSITSYSWGAKVTINNNTPSTQTVTLTLNGIPLEIARQKITVQNDNSIMEYGKIRYTFPNNPLIQTVSLAETIANTLLSRYKDSRRDTELQWRGNPALLLGDRVSIEALNEISDYFVVGQEISFAGYLRARLNGRRVT